ncbi:MAG: helix-turn-helix transcriptional regulator [Lachnospiraceae bacterium]|nr:helix-turn-helix transcriptional regulator [Lachnospiraceae bacterium]
MNGIKYIREKSNFTKNALAERIGVTRQTITLWEQGVRKPGKEHLKWLCDFYGVEEKWFGDLSEEDMDILKEKKMYRHFDGDKEYFTFIPEIDGWAEISIPCGELDAMLDEKLASTMKKKKDFLKRVDDYLKYERPQNVSLFDKILVAERGMNDIECFLDLMGMKQKVGEEGDYLKIPFRYEIKTALYAMMVASGKCSIEEIKEANESDFKKDYGIRVDEDYLNELAEFMRKHWTDRRDGEIKRVTHYLESRKKKNTPTSM